MFQMLGVFADFERAMIRERVMAGLARARADGKQKSWELRATMSMARLWRDQGARGGGGLCHNYFGLI
jgi:DNA invertase Pin-like site-specific DNA recombinase